MLRDMSPGMLRARLGPRSRARGDAPGGAEPGAVQGGGGPPVGGPPGAAAPSSAMRPPLSRGGPPARTASASQRTSSGGMHVLSVINLDTFLNNFRRAPAAAPSTGTHHVQHMHVTAACDACDRSHLWKECQGATLAILCT